MLAATTATASLLGRARIRKRLEQAERHAEKFSEATDFTCFDDRPLHPLSPLRALRWFQSLIPGLRPKNPEQFEQQHEREGFNLAVTTEQTLLERIKGIIARVLQTGERVRSTPKVIEKVMDNAGVTPKNPQYAEMCFRTSMMRSYTQGAQEEMRELKDDFPAWRYVGIRDGRQGKDHEPHFDKYFPNSVSFDEVRGKRIYNCRCDFIPIHRTAWRRLQAQGAAFSSFAERDVSDEPRDDSGKWTAGGGGSKKAKPAKSKPAQPPEKAKFIGQAVGAAEHAHADHISHSVASWVGGVTEEDAGGPGQKDKKPFDVRVKKKGGGFHDIEVKSLLKGGKTSISVHEDALLRKVDHVAANPNNEFHTVVVDERETYGGGEFKGNYSGHRLYYKRGSGRYSLGQMYLVKSEAELKKLIALPDDKLPEAARGHLPPPPPIEKLREAAQKASESRKARDKERKERNKELLQAQARARATAKKELASG